MSNIVRFAETGILIAYLRKAGVPDSEIRRSASISPSQLRAIGQGLPLDRAYALWRLAMEVSGDEAIALRLGETARVRYENDFVASLRPGAPLRETIESTVSCFHATQRTFRIGLSRQGGALLVSFDNVHPAYGDRVSAECCFASLLKGCRAESGRPIVPAYAEFRHEEPRRADAYEELFACPLRFGQARNIIAFRLEDMLLPSKGRKEADRARRGARQEAELSAADEREALLEDVQRFIADGLPRRAHDSAAVASSMGLSRTTLYRKLAEFGTSYRDQLRELRQRLALDHLSAGRSATEVSELLGFAEPAAFHHAFASWFSVPPGRLATALADRGAAVL